MNQEVPLFSRKRNELLSNFHTLRPSSHLAHYVKSSFTFRMSRDSEREFLAYRIPDGCIRLWFTTFFDAKGATVVRGSLLVGGVKERPVLVPNQHGYEGFGVTLFPWAARALLGVPGQELSHRVFDMRDIWGPEASLIVEQLIDAGSAKARLELLNAVLLHRLKPTHECELASEAIRIINTGEGRQPVQRLAHDFGVSTRHLRRSFDEHIGLSPKAYAQNIRTLALLARIHAIRGEVNWSHLALEAGYFDQAHMAHEFRQRVGFSPGRYLAALRTKDLDFSEGLCMVRSSAPQPLIDVVGSSITGRSQ